MSIGKKSVSIIRSSAAEYLTFIIETGDGGVNAIYADENVWLSQKMIAALYNVGVNTINYHLKNLFKDNELDENAVIRDFRITVEDGKSYIDSGKVTAKIAKNFAESEFEKYRIIQDKLFESDFDKFINYNIELKGGEESE